MSSHKRNHAGSVYIAEFGPCHVKIGKSKDPVRRLRTISNQSGVKATKIWVSPPSYNYDEVERELHEKFEKHRGVGEYFNLEFDVAVGSLWTFHFDTQSAERGVEPDHDKSPPTSSQDPVVPTPGELMLTFAENLLRQERILEDLERRLAALEGKL